MSTDIIIEEANVTLATLAVELERAMIANEASGNDSLYVNEPGMFPFWVEIREGARFILLHSYLEFQSECSQSERLEFCDRINLRLYMPSVHVGHIEGDGAPAKFRLVGNYPIYYRDGLLTSHFIRLCRLFSDGMKQVVAEFDAEHQFVQPL